MSIPRARAASQLPLKLVAQGVNVIQPFVRNVAVIDRPRELTRELLAFGRQQPVKPARIDLNELIQQRLPTLRRVVSEDVLVVDLMCDPRLLQVSSYSSDGFHPNDTGYAIIAEKVLPALRDGAAASPSTACAQRTIF